VLLNLLQVGSAIEAKPPSDFISRDIIEVHPKTDWFANLHQIPEGALSLCIDNVTFSVDHHEHHRVVEDSLNCLVVSELQINSHRLPRVQTPSHGKILSSQCARNTEAYLLRKLEAPGLVFPIKYEDSNSKQPGYKMIVRATYLLDSLEVWHE
jgi:hypothetical protein